MVAKSLIAMQKIAGYGADKMPGQGYETEFAGVTGNALSFFVRRPTTETEKGRCYCVTVQDASNGDKVFTCPCAFHVENRAVYGDDTCCKHTVQIAREMEAEEARIIALVAQMEEENERREEYRFDADPFH